MPARKRKSTKRSGKRSAAMKTRATKRRVRKATKTARTVAKTLHVAGDLLEEGAAFTESVAGGRRRGKSKGKRAR